MKAVMTGMVTGKRTLITKSSKMMAFLVLEDLYGVCEVVVFPNVYEKCADCLKGDGVIAVTGTVNFKEDEAPKLLADKIVLIDEETSPEKAESAGDREPCGQSLQRLWKTSLVPFWDLKM